MLFALLYKGKVAHEVEAVDWNDLDRKVENDPNLSHADSDDWETVKAEALQKRGEKR